MMIHLLFLVTVLLAPAFGHETADPGSAASAALSWLLAGRARDGGWGRDTARAVTALNLVNSSALTAADRQLAGKQLQIELLADIWRHREYPVTSRRLAEYVLSLTSSCVDVRNFQGKDLTAMLHHHRHESEFEEAPAVLATCAARTRVGRRSFLRLLASIDGRHGSTGTGSLALSVSALRCVAGYSSRRVERHLEQAAWELVGRQMADGSFGDLGDTLMAVQALRQEPFAGWDEAAALNSVLSHRRPDGSFGGAALTATAAWVLAGRSLLDTADTPCHRPSTAPAPDGPGPATNGASARPSTERATNLKLPSSPRRLIDVTLWLWIGADVGQTFSCRLSVPQNSTLFDCMKLAAERDPHFQFSAKLWPNGHYIDTIDGHREQKDGYHFWLLYSLTAPPDPANRPKQRDLHSTGVDQLVPADGTHILFWYREV